jgi:hypothetical protein
MTKTFIWRMFKEEHPYRTVTSQALCNMVERMPNRLNEVSRGVNFQVLVYMCHFDVLLKKLK